MFIYIFIIAVFLKHVGVHSCVIVSTLRNASEIPRLDLFVRFLVGVFLVYNFFSYITMVLKILNTLSLRGLLGYLIYFVDYC
jgi:hypothetical protein